MIKSVLRDRERFETNLSFQNGFIAEKILREYKCRNRLTYSNFYSAGDSCLMISGENLSFRGPATPEDLRQIVSFCHFMGLYGLESENENIPVINRQTFLLMRYQGGAGENWPDLTKNRNIYRFSQFCSANFPGSSFEAIYSNFAGKVNRGLSDTWILQENGQILCGALVTRYTDDLYITFVSTLPKMRRKGLAGKLIRHIVRERGSRGAILMCEKELAGFYKNLGFEAEREIYLYRLRDEKI